MTEAIQYIYTYYIFICTLCHFSFFCTHTLAPMHLAGYGNGSVELLRVCVYVSACVFQLLQYESMESTTTTTTCTTTTTTIWNNSNIASRVVVVVIVVAFGQCQDVGRSFARILFGKLHSTLYYIHPTGNNRMVTTSTASSARKAAMAATKAVEQELQHVQRELQQCQDKKNQEDLAHAQQETLFKQVAAFSREQNDDKAVAAAAAVPSQQQQSPFSFPHTTIPPRFTNDDNIHEYNDNNKRNPLCQQFPVLRHGSPLRLWVDALSQIHRASQLQKNDPRYLYHDFTAQLLQLVTPRLPRAVVQLPHQWDTVQAILRKVHARYQYLTTTTTHTHTTVPPPVKIVIMGGSILIGRNCRKLNKDMNIQMPLPVRMYVWERERESRQVCGCVYFCNVSSSFGLRMVKRYLPSSTL